MKDGLTDEEWSLLTTPIIDFNGELSHALAIFDKRVKFIRDENATYKANFLKNTYIVFSDNLGEGVQGVFNHADGKLYDSKSQYNKAVRAAGCYVVGNDLNNQNLERKEVRGDFNVRPELSKVVHQVLNRSH